MPTNNNAEITNEGITTIYDEQRSFKCLDVPMLLRCDEGETEIAGKIMMHCKKNQAKKEAQQFLINVVMFCKINLMKEAHQKHKI